ncbi:peroxiredoxin-2E-2, chloroplastic [Diospyros lotus]|uniref:peroxiredoxin-2E-2, chloroplastic n=1 Tax=Diospyros lotus TaxID=55363 RepID=UPI00225755C5|nr:peroxiredoxin-2E-2, chloroplastic [Diospyros lotus]
MDGSDDENSFATMSDKAPDYSSSRDRPAPCPSNFPSPVPLLRLLRPILQSHPNLNLSLPLSLSEMAATVAQTMSRLLSSPKPISVSSTASLLSPRTLSSTLLSTRLRSLQLRQHRTTSHRFSTASAPPSISAAIKVGDKLPDATLSYFDAADELQTVTVSDLTAGKKAIFFAVPGAFTPTCSQKHLPGFVEKAAELKAKGVDTITCVSVNDAFVMKAWKKDLNVGDQVLLLSDGNGIFTKAIGCELDLSDKPVGLGVRSRRYAMLVDDGVVKVLNLEEGGAFTFSGAEDMLKAL